MPCLPTARTDAGVLPRLRSLRTNRASLPSMRRCSACAIGTRSNARSAPRRRSRGRPCTPGWLPQRVRDADGRDSSVEPALQDRKIGTRFDARVVVHARRELAARQHPAQGGTRLGQPTLQPTLQQPLLDALLDALVDELLLRL